MDVSESQWIDNSDNDDSSATESEDEDLNELGMNNFISLTGY